MCSTLRRMASIEAVGARGIRRLVPDEWATLRQVRLTALADAPDAFSSTLDQELAFDEHRWRKWIFSSACFAAWRDGQPTGLACGFDDKAAVKAARDDAGPGAWHLVAMWVSPRARGSGMADNLVEAVCAAAAADGAPLVALWVTDVNARARAFYRRMGFVSTGRRQLVRPEQSDHWEEQLERQLG
jgi:ribosomal protein S18 acetylase RimI-like enzyme